MKVREALRFFGAAVLALALAATADAAPATGSTRRSSGEEKESATRYIVVQVRSMQGEVSFEAIPPNTLQNRVRQCRTDYKKALEDWMSARAKARKAREEFTEKKPVEPYVRRVSSVFKSKGKAEEYARKLQQLYDARMQKIAESKKSAAEKPAPGDQPVADPETGDD